MVLDNMRYYSLPHDICRCHDDGCPERGECLRWLCKDDVGEHVVNAKSLFPYDIPLMTPCPTKIPTERSKNNGSQVNINIDSCI